MKRDIFRLSVLLAFVIAGFSACQDEMGEPFDNFNMAEVIEPGVLPIFSDDGNGGNTTCSEAAVLLGLPEEHFEFSTDRVDVPFNDGDFTDELGGSFAISLTDGKSVSWVYTPPAGFCLVDVAFILKGGNASNIYYYNDGTTSDSGLVSPVNDGGNIADLSNLTICWNIEPCNGNGDCEWIGETAFGGDTEGEGSAWWFAFDTEGEAIQPIYAGQKLVDEASVQYDAENDVLTIELGAKLRLNLVSINPRTGAESPNTEPVKVQGYDELPESRPAAGLFELYKGTELEIQGNGSRYYVIHLDVEVKVCEDEDDY